MRKNRLEAFSDGVLAIIITIMVLEFKVPEGSELSDLKPMIPAFMSYVLSFLYLAIYWNNHHHMLHTVTHVSGKILWANFHLLFWLSLIPFVTDWMDENHMAPVPMALYGFVLLMAAMAYNILQSIIIKKQGEDSLLAKALGKNRKGVISLLLYIIAIGSSFISVWIAGITYILVALMWLIPNKQIEEVLKQNIEQQ